MFSEPKICTSLLSPEELPWRCLWNHLELWEMISSCFCVSIFCLWLILWTQSTTKKMWVYSRVWRQPSSLKVKLWIVSVAYFANCRYRIDLSYHYLWNWFIPVERVFTITAFFSLSLDPPWMHLTCKSLVSQQNNLFFVMLCLDIVARICLFVWQKSLIILLPIVIVRWAVHCHLKCFLWNLFISQLCELISCHQTVPDYGL